VHATPEGTRRFHARLAAVAPDHARSFDGLALSSVGLGTYLGAADEATDGRYAAAVARAIQLGINVIDTAINYRMQRSERTVGKAIAALPRDELVIASKAGFLPFDGHRPSDPAAYFDATFVRSGLARRDEIVAGCHCIAPRYLADQLAKSRANLGVATIDVYYLHNPETQLDEVDRATFLTRMRAAFEALEQAVAAGHIRYYGTATWSGYREAHTSPAHLDLAELVDIAHGIAGDGHHFRFVQLPLNKRMPEAATSPTQRGRPLLDAAPDLGVCVMSSASIHQGKLDPAGALAWTRGQPGLTTALVGMSRAEHVEANVTSFRRAAP
jgi:aryl-alcohol dehydrogenase-like predicted oxidoreductase